MAANPIPENPTRIAGLISGTSADGVDVAIVDFDPRPAVVAFATAEYDPVLRRRVRALFNPETSSVDEICRMHFILGEVFADALVQTCSRSGIQLSSVDAIGSHGQTIQHLPYGCEWAGRTIRSTLQIAAPAVIAERTGCCVVSDFRAADIAAGGSGAPLVALVDHELLADPRTSRVVQNIGGIANLTWLPAGAEVEDVLAFDTGPGNLLLDALVRRLTGGRENFDRDGRLALAGRIDQSMVADWAKHPYFDRKPPKSTGPEEFAGHWVDDLVHRATDRGLAGADLLATATAFVAESIAQAYRRYLPADVDEVLLCGGGAANPALVDQLRLRLPAGRVENLSSVGIDPDAKEALSFAILARRTLLGLAGNVPGATGAGRAVVLGSITPGRAAR